MQYRQLSPLAERAIDFLQDCTRQHRIRWEIYFQDADRHRNKLVSPHAIRRGFKASRVELEPELIEALIKEFTAREGFVNYQHMCDRIDQVFTTKGLQKCPTKTPKPALPPNENRHYSTFNANNLDEEEKRMLHESLENLKRKVQNEGTVVKLFFKDFDRLNIGFVTREQFQRGCKMMFADDHLSSHMVHLITKAYSDARGDINYRRFARDIDNSTVQWNLGAQPSLAADVSQYDLQSALNRGARGTKDDQTLKRLEDQMRFLVHVEGLRLKVFFEDWDKMRKYTIPVAQFTSALNLALGKKIHFTDKSLNLVAQKYASGPPDANGSFGVNYLAFIESIDVDATEVKDLHTMPCKETQFFDPHQGLSGETTPRFAQTDAEQMHLQSLLSKLRNSVSDRRPHLKPIFEDFDRLHRSEVTRAQFMRVLAQELSQVYLNETDMEVLADAYTKPGTEGSKVDYIQFIRAVDQMYRPNSRRGTTTGGSLATTATTMLGSAGLSVLDNNNEGTYSDLTARTYEEALDKIRRIVKTLRIRLSEFLEDADTMRHGTILKSQLLRGLSRAQIQLSEEEVSLLASKHLTCDGKVRWRDLLGKIELAEWQMGLHLAPTKSGTPVPLRQLRPAYEMVQAERERTELLIDALRNEVRHSRALLAPTFQHYDKHNHGKLSRSLFRRALDSLGMRALREEPEDSFELLALRFCVPGDSETVNYSEFVRSVESTESRCNGGGALTAYQIADEAVRMGFVNNNRGDEQQNQRVEQQCTTGFESQDEAEQLLVRVQDQCWSRRIRVKEFLCDYDRLRQGSIPASKFLSALKMAGLELNPRELTVLRNRFAMPNNPNKILYMPFVHRMDGGDERLEEDPTREMVNRISRNLNERNKRRVPDDEVKQVLAPMRREVKLRQILLKDQFRYFDRQHLKAITLHQFASVLKMNNLLPEENYEYVLKVLHAGFPASHEEKIDYQRFIEELE